MGKTRSALAPELPTIAESGFPEFDGTFWILLAAPKGQSAQWGALVRKIHLTND